MEKLENDLILSATLGKELVEKNKKLKLVIEKNENKIVTLESTLQESHLNAEKYEKNLSQLKLKYEKLKQNLVEEKETQQFKQENKDLKKQVQNLNKELEKKSTKESINENLTKKNEENLEMIKNNLVNFLNKDLEVKNVLIENLNLSLAKRDSKIEKLEVENDKLKLNLKEENLNFNKLEEEFIEFKERCDLEKVNKNLEFELNFVDNLQTKKSSQNTTCSCLIKEEKPEFVKMDSGMELEKPDTNQTKKVVKKTEAKVEESIVKKTVSFAEKEKTSAIESIVPSVPKQKVGATNVDYLVKLMVGTWFLKSSNSYNANLSSNQTNSKSLKTSLLIKKNFLTKKDQNNFNSNLNHRRFFFVNPFTKTLCWNEGDEKDSKIKFVKIKSCSEVKVEGEKLIAILTEKNGLDGELLLKAFSKPDHDFWIEGLSNLDQLKIPKQGEKFTYLMVN
ncbi:hypothetical protein HK099_002104 [Clydaea vesicula]|uniref:PH domain-containing protein n=1 Tax=Clydaea vesicula TaxID=447962 RepID=A0AAD5XWP6_9FUNG|nr:hypothetical protein HK099_002104 [Clydaea vesicula]